MVSNPFQCVWISKGLRFDYAAGGCFRQEAVKIDLWQVGFWCYSWKRLCDGCGSTGQPPPDIQPGVQQRKWTFPGYKLNFFQVLFPGTFYNTNQSLQSTYWYSDRYCHCQILLNTHYLHFSYWAMGLRCMMWAECIFGSVGERECVPGRGGWCGGASATSWFAPLWRSFSGSHRPAGSYPLFL